MPGAKETLADIILVSAKRSGGDSMAMDPQ